MQSGYWATRGGARSASRMLGAQMIRPIRRPLGMLTALALAVPLLLITMPGAPSTAAAGPSASGTALGLLAGLRATSEHYVGYARSLFVHWIDADGDGCDTRDEVLLQESRTTPRTGAGCSVFGTWRSAYDGKTTTRASTFDIDHMVALKEAWDSGAWAWTRERRQAYANDLGDSRSLRAVSAASNRSKSDKDPAEWVPPLASFRCTYASEWVVVKTRWDLAVDSREKAVLRRLLAPCPTKTLSVAVVPVGDAAPPPTTGPEPSAEPHPTTTPSPAPIAGGCDPNYAGWCVPIVPYDLDCKDIGHRVTVVGIDIHHLDGDGDGIGCESYPG